MKKIIEFVRKSWRNYEAAQQKRARAYVAKYKKEHGYEHMNPFGD